ncbi:hypothetical protein NUSPORA_00721 [Nucleospora cyclopteri]
MKKSKIQKTLNKLLGPEFLSVRQGFGCVKLTYVEGWAVIGLANKIFGYNGWNSTIKEITQEYLEVSKDNKVSVGYSSLCRITLSDGTYKEDVGFGSSDNLKSKGMAIEKAKKEAVTDSLKRALRQFGNLLGNCCYNKSYLKYVSKLEKKKNLSTLKEENIVRSLNEIDLSETEDENAICSLNIEDLETQN